MDLSKYETEDEIKAAIERRQEALQALEPYKGWHFSQTKEYRKIERNLARLKHKLETWKGCDSVGS